MEAVGIDGCRGGWAVISINGAKQREFQIFQSIEQLTAIRDAVAMIDIPIGLPDSGYRDCDLAARKKLVSAWPRVFLGVRRPLLEFCDDYLKANLWAKKDGKGLARQCFCILKKVREVDRFITPERQKQFLRETHPELIFQKLNGGVPLPNKKKPEDRKQRIAILESNGFTNLTSWLTAFPRKDVKPDDLFDACACAIAASNTITGKGERLDCRAETALSHFEFSALRFR